MRSKTEREEALLREFLQAQPGLKILTLKMMIPPKPDAWVDIANSGQTRAIDIEITEYHVDSTHEAPRGSPGVMLHRVWQKIQEHVAPSLAANPLEVAVLVTLKDRT